MEDWEPAENSVPKAKTPIVAAVLIGVALLFSWIGCYAAVGVLQKVELIPPFQPNHDPRLMWFVTTFLILLAVFGGIALIAHLVSHRQLHNIDQMDNEA